MLLARTEALDEVEAAAEQRFAAALARERADLAKQARSLSCMRSSWLQRPSLVQQSMRAIPRESERLCMLYAWQHGACGSGAQLDANSSLHSMQLLR